MDPSVRHAPFIAVVASIFAFAWTVLGGAPVLAHEFTVGIILDPKETRSSAFMKGFQLAVDQSPDVSHPPGVEGGDHLGSLDVLMTVRDGAKRPDQFASAALDLIERKGASIIVADVSPDALAALLGPVAESETVLIAMAGPDEVGVPPARFFFAADRQAGADVLLNDRKPRFARAFMAAYGRQPSAAAARGYIAGRLVDIGVEATDEDPSDEKTLIPALVAATTIADSELENEGNAASRVACELARLLLPFHSDRCMN